MEVISNGTNRNVIGLTVCYGLRVLYIGLRAGVTVLSRCNVVPTTNMAINVHMTNEPPMEGSSGIKTAAVTVPVSGIRRLGWTMSFIGQTF